MSAPLLLGCAAAALILGLPVVGAATALAIEARTAAAADAAALAAADALNGWISADPCEIAAAVTASNKVSLFGCVLDDSSGSATVTVQAFTMLGTVQVRSRAGPPVIQ